MESLKHHPDLRIYHFAPYEPAALKRLMGRYASREEEIDFLLRSRCFVDLYGVVRNGLQASVESYSIKKLEPLYGFSRDTTLSDANAALAKVQACLELGDIEFINEDDRRVVAGYNRDDCVSTWRLRDWLEARRAELVASGTAVSRPDAPEGAPTEALGEWQERMNALIERLTSDVPSDVADRTTEQHARWLLAHTLSVGVASVRTSQSAPRWRRRTWARDRGMIPAETIAGLEERKLEYILGARERSDAVVRKIVLDNDDPFVPLLVERKTGETQLFVKQVKVEGKRYVVCRNEQEAENNRKDREAIVAALDAQLKRGDKALIGNSAYRRYLRQVGAKDKRSFEIDAGKLAEEALRRDLRVAH